MAKRTRSSGSGSRLRRSTPASRRADRAYWDSMGVPF